MTITEAREFRSQHDQQVKRLTRMSKVQLRNLLDRQYRAAGIIRWGGLASKDELIRELLDLDFPLERLNEAITTLASVTA